MTKQLQFISLSLLSLLVIVTGCASSDMSHCSVNSGLVQQTEFRGQDSCQSCSMTQNQIPQSNQSVPATVSGSMAGTFLYNNSISVTSCNPIGLWEAIVSVVSRYFPIYNENACRQIGEHVTPGNLTTGRTIGATIFEPWRKDSVGFKERWESTIHSISRYAIIRVWPTGTNTYTIEVIVNKEIENSHAPDKPSTGQGNYFLSDSRSTFRDNIISDIDDNQWVNHGRDPLLEQRILAEIMAKVN